MFRAASTPASSFVCLDSRREDGLVRLATAVGLCLLFSDIREVNAVAAKVVLPTEEFDIEIAIRSKKDWSSWRVLDLVDTRRT